MRIRVSIAIATAAVAGGALTACQAGVEQSATAAVPAPPKRDPGAPPDHEDPRIELREHMRDNYDLARSVESLLIRGRLDAALDLARLIAVAPVPTGASPYAAEVAAVRVRAEELARSGSVEEALRAEARLAAACAECHRATGAAPLFTVTADPPLDVDTVAARMARHRWAVGMLWDGTIGGDDAAWTAGLDVLAAAPLPFPGVSDRAGYARRLQQLAITARADAGGDAVDRTRMHGELLVTCAACHAVPARPAPTSPNPK